MFKKKNYKLLIGIIVGMLISATGVYAVAYYDTASNLTYDNTSSGLSSTNAQDAIEELYKELCPDGYSCQRHKTTLELGDYVSYTPTSTSYTTDTSYTNYSSTQTINPSELNLWRVLNINDDGTVDLISEYVSSVNIYFKGQLGYQNLVGYLNVLASQYETEGITEGSRHFGYNGQTEYITDTSKFTNPAPWVCSTTSAECDDSPPVESQGGGDKLYNTDYEQVQTALGTRITYKVGTTSATTYWMASRDYFYSSDTNYSWSGRYIDTSGIGYNYYFLYRYFSSSFNTYNGNSALRPIVTLKSGLTYGNGTGKAYAPMQIIS